MNPIVNETSNQNRHVAKILSQLMIYTLNYFSYSALLFIITYSFALAMVAIIESPLEAPIVSLISGHLGGLNINVSEGGFSVIADGKNVTQKVSIILFFLIPVIFGIVVEVLKKLIKLKISTKYLSVFLIFLWIIGSIVMGFKIKNFFVPVLFLSAALFQLGIYKVIGFVIKHLSKVTERF